MLDIGKVYDVVSLFSTSRRDFLIRRDGERVNVDSLKGKIVGIYFISLAEESTVYDRVVMSDLVKVYHDLSPDKVYHDLSPDNNFEVVLVAGLYHEDSREDRMLFDKYFLMMPWLAIPQDDHESRAALFSLIGSDLPPLCPILDEKGKIVNRDASLAFGTYGAEGYPFSLERLDEIHQDDMLARTSITRLLSSTPFLRRANCEKVPISYLEGKVVGFYFYHRSRSADELIELHEKLRKMGKQFEIVFINTQSWADTDYKSLMETFNRTSWLLDNRSYLKLKRIFHPQIGQLVIFGPGEEFPETYGLDVIRHFGIEAYPFTRRRATEMEVERLKSLTLESILFSGDCKYIEGNGGQKITAHHLVNKTIFLLFTEKRSSRCQALVLGLVTWYNETKESFKEDLEIIHIPYDYDPAKECYYGTMPWLQFPYNANYIEKLFQNTLDLYRSMPLVIAFGVDGKIMNMNKIEYPFTFSDDHFFSVVERRVADNMEVANLAWRLL